MIRTSAVDARAASRNGSSLLSGRSKDSAKEGAFILFERRIYQWHKKISIDGNMLMVYINCY